VDQFKFPDLRSNAERAIMPIDEIQMVGLAALGWQRTA